MRRTFEVCGRGVVSGGAIVKIVDRRSRRRRKHQNSATNYWAMSCGTVQNRLGLLLHPGTRHRRLGWTPRFLALLIVKPLKGGGTELRGYNESIRDRHASRAASDRFSHESRELVAFTFIRIGSRLHDVHLQARPSPCAPATWPSASHPLPGWLRGRGPDRRYPHRHS